MVFSIMRKGFGFISLKTIIFMILNISHNYANFFYRMIEQLAISFIVFINISNQEKKSLS